MTRRQNLNGYDTTRYRNFDGERVAHAVAENLYEAMVITEDERDRLHEHFEQGSTARSPAELAAEVPDFAAEHAGYFAALAVDTETPRRKRRYYDEADFSFGLAVVHELIARDEWAAAEYTIECARSLGGFGPINCAKEEGLDPDPRDDEAVGQIADSLVTSYEAHAGSVEDRETGIQYGPALAEKSDESQRDVVNARLNNGKDHGTHKVYGELARLEEEGVDIQGHRIMHTPEDDFPDFLEIQYGGVSANEIEELRYRHIDTTRYYGVAARPLSEIPAVGDDEVSK